MKLGTALLAFALIAAPACGGGGGDSDPGGSPTPVAAGFVAEVDNPSANTAAMAEGSKANDVVTVNVTLTNTNGVYGTAFEVVYDAIHTSYIGYAPGTAFEQGGASVNYTITANSTATPPRIVVGISRAGGATTNVSGTKTVVGLQFRVEQAGVFPLRVENPAVYDGQSTPQPIPDIDWYAGAVEGI